jgi:hypothetical protein
MKLIKAKILRKRKIKYPYLMLKLTMIMITCNIEVMNCFRNFNIYKAYLYENSESFWKSKMIKYSLRSILLFSNTDISTTKMCLDTSILAKSIMGRREYCTCMKMLGKEMIPIDFKAKKKIQNYYKYI